MPGAYRGRMDLFRPLVAGALFLSVATAIRTVHLMRAGREHERRRVPLSWLSIGGAVLSLVAALAVRV